jgi:hypothetical protein
VDVVHDHLEVVGASTLAAMAPAVPPVLHTLHWDLRKHPDFYGRFDGAGRVWCNGVSDSQVARAPEALRRHALGAVPLAVDPARSRSGRRRARASWSWPGSPRSRARTSRRRPAGRAAGRWTSPARSRAPRIPRRSTRAWPTRAPTCTATPTCASTWIASARSRAGDRLGRLAHRGEKLAVLGRARALLTPDPLGRAGRHRRGGGAGLRDPGGRDAPRRPADARRARRDGLPRRRSRGAARAAGPGGGAGAGGVPARGGGALLGRRDGRALPGALRAGGRAGRRGDAVSTPARPG